MAQPTDNRPVKYAFCHDREHGRTFHARYVGNGSNASVTLVRQEGTGEFIVRKRAVYDTPGPRTWNEINHPKMMNHPNIPPVLWSCDYPSHKDPGYTSIVSYWPYYNGQDLSVLVSKFHAAGHRVPEVVVWRFLRHILGALRQTHMQGIRHCDNHHQNIFVHWTAEDRLPTFILGDWGLSEPFTAETATVKDISPEHLAQPDSYMIPPEHELPDLSLEILSDYENVQPERGTLPSLVEDCLGDLGNEYTNLNELLERSLMAEHVYDHVTAQSDGPAQDEEEGDADMTDQPADEDDEEEDDDDDMAPPEAADPEAEANDDFYSPELQSVTRLLDALEAYMSSPLIRTVKRYLQLVDMIYEQVVAIDDRYSNEQLSQQALAALRDVHPFGVPGDTAAHPQRQLRQETILTFDSLQEMHNSGCEPAGPYKIAILDAKTGQLLQLSNNVFAHDNVYCSDAEEVRSRQLLP